MMILCHMMVPILIQCLTSLLMAFGKMLNFIRMLTKTTLFHHAVPAQNAGHGNAAPAAKGEPMIHTPRESPREINQNNMNLQPAIEATDAFIAMHNLIGDIITNLPDILVE
jgi:hypothetical protein